MRYRFPTTHYAVALALTLCATASVHAQGSKSDYERALELRQRYSGKVLNSSLKATWLQDNKRFHYRSEGADGKKSFVLVRASNGTKRALFNHSRLAGALQEAAGRNVDADRLPFDSVSFHQENRTIDSKRSIAIGHGDGKRES